MPAVSMREGGAYPRLILSVALGLGECPQSSYDKTIELITGEPQLFKLIMRSVLLALIAKSTR